MNDISDETVLLTTDAVAPTADSAANSVQASRDITPGVDTGSDDQRDVEAMLVDSQDIEMGVSADARPTVGGKTYYAVAVENDIPDSQDETLPQSRATSPPSDSHPSVGGKTYYMVPLQRESTILSEDGLAEPPERPSIGGKTWIPSAPPAGPEKEDIKADDADSKRPTLGGKTRMPSMPPPTSETSERSSLGSKTLPSIPTALSGEEDPSPGPSIIPEKTRSGSENADITMEDTTEQEDEHDDDEESVLSDGGEFREEFEAAMGGDFAFKGSYAYSGILPQAPNPCLSIEGIGPVGLPLSPRDARLIIERASQAPYGHNEQTIVNTEVCDTWEIDQESIKFENPLWDTFLKQTVVPTISQSLGTPSTNVRCDLYKLLLYQEGSHFHKHQDTAKVPGMFGTIIIILPSPYKGGEVHVSHSGSSQVFDFSEQSLVSTSVLAWYTDVFHEVRPVKSGYRLALSYNLVQTVPTVALPSLPNMHSAVQLLRRVLRKWRKDSFQSDPVDLVAYVLSHEYSAAELQAGATALKGQDAHKMAHLQSVAKDLGYMVCLGNLSYRQSGQAEDMGFHSGYGWKRRRYGYYDEDEDEDEDESSHRMGEDYETFLTVDNIVDMKGKYLLASGKASLDLDDDSLVPQDPFDGEDPDDEEYEGYMGNYGGTLDHFYRRTVLMLMHEDDAPQVFFSAAGGINYGLQRLKDSTSETPTPDDLKIANLVIDRLNVQNKQSAMSMSEFAIKWKNLEMWKRIVKATAFDLSAYGLDRLVNAWRTFTFEDVRPVLEEMVTKTSKLKATHDFLKGISEAATDDEPNVREWSRAQLSQALLNLTTLDSEDVPILVSVIKDKGSVWFSETIMPRLAKSPSLYSFWIAFIQSLHANREAIQETGSDSSTPKSDLLVQCLDNVLNLWESVVAAPAPRPYYYSGPPAAVSQQPTVTRVIQLVDLCISTDHTEMCETLFVTILKRKPPNRANFQTLYTPVIPELRQLLQKKKIDVCAPPFADIMQVFIGSYLRDVLGARPRAVSMRRLGCGCAECGMLNTFLKNTSTETTLRFLQAKRNHIEGFLRGASDLVTYEIVRTGRPQGLLVRKRPEVLASLQWSTRQAEAKTFLNMIGDEDVISKLVGRRYADVLRALEGTKQFTLPMHPATGPPSIDVDAPPQNASTSLSSSSSSIVVGTKRKQPRKPVVITGPVIDLTED